MKRGFTQNLPRYGQYKDWRDACAQLPRGRANRNVAAAYFQANFQPLDIGGADGSAYGLLLAAN